MHQYINMGNQIGGLTGTWSGPIVVGVDKMYMIKRRSSDGSGELGISRGMGGGLLGAAAEMAVRAAMPTSSATPPVLTRKLSELRSVTSHPDWPLSPDFLQYGLPKRDDCDVMIYDKGDVRIRKVMIINRAMVTVEGRSYKVDHIPFTWWKIRKFLDAHGWLTP